MNHNTAILENIVELSRAYQYALDRGLSGLGAPDSRAVAVDIGILAEQFETEYRDVDWNQTNLDYYVEIKRFVDCYLVEKYL